MRYFAMPIFFPNHFPLRSLRRKKKDFVGTIVNYYQHPGNPQIRTYFVDDRESVLSNIVLMKVEQPSRLLPHKISIESFFLFLSIF